MGIGKLLKGVLGAATSLLPGASVVKGILGLAAKKIPGAEPILQSIFNEAEKIYEERADIRAAYLKAQEEQNKFLSLLLTLSYFLILPISQSF